jgi:hypothetical protein
MEIFIETIEHSELRDRFRRAIRGRGAFRRFKDLLLEHLDVRDAWFAFKNERNQERALRWLERCDIELIDD